MIRDYCNIWSWAAFDPAGVQAVAGIAKGVGKMRQGRIQQQQAGYEADAVEKASEVNAESLRSKALWERAATQRQALEMDDKTQRVISTQVARAASSGAGASSATVLDLIGDTAARGSYLSDTERAGGEERARGMEDRANFGEWQGSTKAKALRQKGSAVAKGTLFEGLVDAGSATYTYGARNNWWGGGSEKPADSDETDWKTGWRTRVYKGG